MGDFKFVDDAVSLATTPLVGPMMTFANEYWWPIWCVLFFLGFLLTLAPWQLPTEHNSFQTISHVIRRSILYIAFGLFALILLIYFLFDITFSGVIKNRDAYFLNWFFNSFNTYKWYILSSAASGAFLRFYYFRFFHPWVSSTLRDLRNKQTNESESDIRDERLKYNAKNFNPEEYYDKKFKKIFLGLDNNNEPVYVPASTWLETNMMVTGPTRYGKGVVLGCLMEQAIIRGDQLIYIDPKNDKFAAKIMLQTCAKYDRPFYYVSLNDDSLGYWSPFEGGKRRDAYNRLISIFGMMENSGDADFYKAMEKKVFNRLIKLEDPFDIESIYRKVKYHNEHVQDDGDRLLKIEAQLENWRQIESLNPPKDFSGFSLEKAMLENAVIYFQGSLNDEVIKTATKSFILEVIQESARLDRVRKSHLTFIIDEVRFLVSKTLADALATIVGFRVNIVTACQSINDLKTPDDINLDGEATYRSISTNSQLKLVYGGADSDTAEWVAKLSGSIVKQVTSMEKVTVKAAGAETWDMGRTVKPLEEALIPENVALTLPPRICVVFRPSELATVTFTSPVKVKDMSELENWLSKQQREEGERITAISEISEDVKNSKVSKINAETDLITALMSPPAPAPVPVPVPVPDTRLLTNPLSLANTIGDANDNAASSSLKTIDEPVSVSSNEADNTTNNSSSSKTKETVIIDKKDSDAKTIPLVVTSNDLIDPSSTLTEIEKPAFIYREEPSTQNRSFDLYELSKKENLDYDEIRYIFAFSARQEEFKKLVEPEYFVALLKKKNAAKKANLMTDNISPTQPKYDINILAKQETHTPEEIRWVLRESSRRDALRSINPELLSTFEKTTQPFPTKNKNSIHIPRGQKYDINILAKQETHTPEEIRWVLRTQSRKDALSSINPELLTIFEKTTEIQTVQNTEPTEIQTVQTAVAPPKYDISKLAKQETHTLDEIRWVLKKQSRKDALSSINPELLAILEKTLESAKIQTDQNTESTEIQTAVAPQKYDINTLAQKTTLTPDEIRWILKNPKRRDDFAILAPNLIAELLSKRQNTPKFQLDELAKKNYLTQEEIDWVLKNDNRKRDLNEIAPHLSECLK